MAFDLSDIFKDVSTPDPGRDVIQYLPYANIIPDAKNGYSMDGLEELARSIELVGLQQPLRVRLLADNSVQILSGHRRHAAIGLILDRNPMAFPDGIPCIIDRGEASAALQELKLILGNADNRNKTPADLLRDMDGLADCLRRLEAEGYHFPGRHREWISKMIGLSKTKIGRLQAIGKHLAPSLLDHFNAGELGITAAYRLSQEREQVQHEVYRNLGRGINDLTEAQLEERINRAKAPRQDPLIKTAPSGNGFDVDAYLQNRAQEDDDFFEMLSHREIVRELVSELDTLNSRTEGIEKLKKTFCHRYSSGYGTRPMFDGKPKGLTLMAPGIDQIFRTWTEVYDMLCTIALNRVATGEDPDDEDEEPEEELPTVRWESRAVTPPQREPLLLYQLTNAGPKYTPAVYCGGAVFRKPAWAGQEGAELTGIAQQFSSWLKFPDPNSYGEEYRLAAPTGEPEWQEGQPDRAGLYYCKAKLGASYYKQSIYRWDGAQWKNQNTGVPCMVPLVAWWPLPDDGEEDEDNA